MKEEQKKLITEIMEADDKDGLYEINKSFDHTQGVVEWLHQKIEKERYQCTDDWSCGYQNALNEVVFFLKEAKQIEKKKLEECWNTAHQAGRFEGKGIAIQNWQTFEQYYNESQEQ